jgi:hypothetical protein
VIPAVGAVVFEVNVMLSVSVHPLDVEVVVIVYVPGEENVFVFHPVLLPPDQENVLPPLPVNDILVCVHVNSVVPLLFVILALGAVVFEETVILSVSVHPFAAVVAVTV